MKTVIFIRGNSNVLKKMVAAQVMQVLNPDVNHVKAIKLSMDDYTSGIHTVIEKNDLEKSADKTVKNLFKKVLMGNESVIVIDNKNLIPSHWRAFSELAKALKIDIKMVGINVTETDNKGDKAFEEEMVYYYSTKGTDGDLMELIDFVRKVT